MSKNLIKRIEKVEQVTTVPRWRAVVRDIDGKYRTDDGQSLGKEAYEAWANKVCKNRDTQLIIVEVTCNLNNINLKIDSHVDKNGLDLLKDYDAVIREAACISCSLTKTCESYKVQEIKRSDVEPSSVSDSNTGAQALDVSSNSVDPTLGRSGKIRSWPRRDKDLDS